MTVELKQVRLKSCPDFWGHRAYQERQTALSNLLEGTLAYMSHPEQTGRMSHLIDYRTDFTVLRYINADRAAAISNNWTTGVLPY